MFGVENTCINSTEDKRCVIEMMCEETTLVEYICKRTR